MRSKTLAHRGKLAATDPSPKRDPVPVSDTVGPPSIPELERRAKAGDGAAASLLGDYYREGNPVLQDADKAFHWYSRGAELGDGEAQNNLGSMFLNGLGCERDPARAIDWYRKSAEQGLAIVRAAPAKRLRKQP